MDGTVLSQGTFTTAAGVPNRIVAIPTNADYMIVRNATEWGKAGTAASGSKGYEFFWQRSNAPGYAKVRYKTATTNAATDDVILTGGFTLFDSSGKALGSQPVIGAAIVSTASTNATKPVVSTATTTNIAVGDVVRMNSTAQTDVNGIDMVVGAVSAGVSITLLTATNVLANAPGAVGGAGFYRKINVDPLFYPRNRYIVNINETTNTVSTSVAHGLTPGQVVRLKIPAAAGMVELDNRSAIVVSITDEYNFVIDIDTSTFTAFSWPTIAKQPSSFPQMTPMGEDTATSLITSASQVPGTPGAQINATQTGLLADSAVNTGFIGMVLGTGAAGKVLTTAISGPAGGSAGDVMEWIAGKSAFGGL